MDTREALDNILSGDKEASQNSFRAIVADKVMDSLEVEKIRIASSLLNPYQNIENNETAQ